MTPAPGNRQGFRTAFAVLGFVCLALAACVTESPVLPVPPADPSQCVWDGVERVVAVGDIHGDYEAFVAILQDHKLLDDHETWIGGNAHLVQLGDVMDRGGEARRIFVLIAKLEKEAAAAGGMVHFLPGNHEELNLAGVSLDYEGYVPIQQFRDFLPTAYRDRHDRLTARMNKTDADAYWKALMKQTGAMTTYYGTFRRTFGRWVAGHNVIVRINGVVFVHGGISAEDSRRSLESINATYRAEFLQAIEERLEAPEFLFQPSSPLWNRDLAEEGSSIIESDVKQILSNLRARAIVVGHTPTRVDGAERFGGLVWLIDSNISSVYEDFGVLSALEIDKTGKPSFKWENRHAPEKRPDGHESFPGDPGDVRLCARLAAASHA